MMVKINPDWIKVVFREANIWIAVYIYRRSPEENTHRVYRRSPSIFLDIIEEYICMYSLITFHHCEKEAIMNSFVSFLKNILR